MDCGNHVALIAPLMPRLQSQLPHYQLRARLHHLGPVRTTTSPTMAGDHHGASCFRLCAAIDRPS